VTFFYRAYGIGIRSDTSIAGLELLSGTSSEASLKFESCPPQQWVCDALKLRARVLVHRPAEQGSADPTFVLTEHGNSEYFELSYADGTTFVVNASTDRIWGKVEPPLTNEDLATYFLGPVMGFVLRRRHVTCLHASAVALCGRGVVFCGDAGYGKSTTAGALALRGVPVIAEDIVPLELTKEIIMAIPGYPRVCLWAEAVEKLAGFPEALPKLTAAWEKRYLPLDGVHGKFSGEKRPLGLIYLFGERSGAQDAPRVEEIAPREALVELVQKTYMNWLLDREQRAKEFDELGRIVSHVPVRRIIAHQNAEKIGALCELILADAGSVLGSVNV
jgi:hypothetical protein